MENILEQLPFIYVYWACGLMTWSAIVCLMLGRVISISRKTKYLIPRTDSLVFITIALGGIMLFISVFVIPQVTVLFIEIALLLSLWYTVFLGIVNHLNIVTWLRYRTLTKFSSY
jgi:hypothetical protein